MQAFLRRLFKALQRFDCDPPLTLRKLELVGTIPNLVEELKPSLGRRLENEINSSDDLEWVSGTVVLREILF